MPPPKSIKVLPSTSVSRAPFASLASIGVAIPRPAETAPLRRSSNARLFGPGISVFSLVDSSIFGTSSRLTNLFQYTHRYGGVPLAHRHGVVGAGIPDRKSTRPEPSH